MLSASWARWNASLTLTPASSASFPHPRGTVIPAPSSSAAKAAGSIPRTARTDPSRPSSPMTYLCPISRPPIAPRIATAMPRSNAVPLFGVSAGERLIVRRACGKPIPAEAKAARIRSRDSDTAASGSPTIVTAGRPWRRTASIRTGLPSIPTTAMAYAVPTLTRCPADAESATTRRFRP